LTYTFSVDVRLLTERKGEKLTFKEARKLVKERGTSKYQGNRFILLQRMTESFYRKNHEDGPVEGRTVTKNIETVKGWVGGISDRQLNRLLNSIEELEWNRNDGKLTYTINFDPLLGLEKSVEVAKRDEDAKNAKRASKARDARARKRQERDAVIARHEQNQQYGTMNVFELTEAASMLSAQSATESIS
jgi:hypothetical protein